ncbi:MAG: TrkH family potassium uptake protein [Gammaproteobacteria bacterium]|nr:TrkH family potassium uptake protein [Gammaproteobacteria bacterium]
MQIQAVQRILGLLLSLFSLTMLPPIFVSWWYRDGAAQPFLVALGIILGVGLLLWLPVRTHKRELRIRDGFTVVMLFWVGLSLSAATPMLLLQVPELSIADAVFEAVSALTTTGATVITGIDDLPPSILFYRQFLQWMGGMGIIVLAVAILPVLGIGGMQLYRAETPGPMKDTKLTPRITETAKALWYIYLSLTVACATAYWLAGMSLFDAVAHSFSTVAIGGFSTHDLSIGYFNNPLVELTAMVFMFLAGINFALHFVVWRARSGRAYLGDAELKAYTCFILFISAVTSGYLYLTGTFPTAFESIRNGVFQTISFSTTTGFTTAGYNTWPSFLPVLLIIASFVGGCAGSTGGGLKVIRVVLLFKQSRREIVRLIHPSAHVSIKVSGSVLPPRVMDAVWGFFAAYIITYAIIMLLLMATGLDQITAYSAVAACLNNLGPGLGDVSSHYGDINAVAKWILCVAMLLGRLEIFTLLVILSPTFWRT